MKFIVRINSNKKKDYFVTTKTKNIVAALELSYDALHCEDVKSVEITPVRPKKKKKKGSK